MRAFLLLLVTCGLLVMFALGNQYGTINTDKVWEPRITKTEELLAEGTYRMAWTNVRACVLAADSDFMRFLSNPTPPALKEFRARYGACEQHWDLLFEYSLNTEEYRNIDDARWMFDNWGEQINWALELQVRTLLALNSGNNMHAAELYKSLLHERDESKKFRDHIERELFEAW
jgi:hypothetical protein